MNTKAIAAVAAIGILGATVALVELPPEDFVPDAGVDSGEPLCVRRRPGADCLRLDGGDPGDWNRYAEGLLVGKCESVPCTVMAGEDAEK